MTDIRTMTLDEILSADDCTIEAAVEFYVFGDDLTASTPQRLKRAVARWRGERSIGAVLALDNYTRLKMQDVESRHLWLWENRENIDRELGGGLRESIEAHVAAWRAPARKFLSDWNETMKIVERLRERGDCTVHICLYREYCRVVIVLGENVTAIKRDGEEIPCRTIVEAALRAMHKKQDGK